MNALDLNEPSRPPRSASDPDPEVPDDRAQGDGCVGCAAAGGVGSQVVGVGLPVQGSRRSPALAVAPEGRVLVVWERGAASPRVMGQIFETDLADPGPVVEMAPATAVVPSAAWGPKGGFVLVWNHPEEVF